MKFTAQNPHHMSYSLNSLKGGYIVIKGDTRSLGYSSYRALTKGLGFRVYRALNKYQYCGSIFRV